MTCTTCPARLVEIQRLDGELAKARQERDEARAGLIPANELPQHVIGERDEARAEVERLKRAERFADQCGELAERLTGGEMLTTVEAIQQLADDRDAARAEIVRLTACLAKANENHEHFERNFYLATDKVARLKGKLIGVSMNAYEEAAAEVDRLKAGLVELRRGIAGAKYYRDEAVTAIDALIGKADT